MPVTYLERLTDSYASINSLLIIVNLKIKLIYTKVLLATLG